MSAHAVKAFVADITQGNLKGVQVRLKSGDVKANARYSDPSAPGAYYSLLHKAADVGHEAIVAALIKNGADVGAVDNNGATPLHWLAAHQDEGHLKIAEDLITKHKASVGAKTGSGMTPLGAAAAHGNAPLVQLLLRHGASARDQGVLHAAARKANWEVMQVLLQAGAQPDAQDSKGFTPLMRILQPAPSRSSRDDPADGYRLRAEVALQALARTDLDWALGTQEPAGGKTALLLAAAWPKPSKKVIEALLAAGAHADAQDKPAGETALVMALKAGHGQLAALLAKHTKQVDAASSSGETPLLLAVALAGKQADGAEALEAVLALQPKVDGKLGTELLRKAMASKWDGAASHLVQLVPDSTLAALDLTFQGLLDQGMGQAACALLARTTPGGLEALATPDTEGNTALHRAAMAGQAGLLAGLLRLGLKANLVNKEGDTALHLAAKAGQLEACRALVDGGADPLWRNGKNRTPGGQLKLSEAVRAYLSGVEELAKLAKQLREKEVWGSKLAATQSDNACVIRAV